MTDLCDLVIRADRVVTPESVDGRTIVVTEGKIVAVEGLDADVSGRAVVEFGPDVAVMPGLVDSHVHICEPGNADWEGFDSATAAAAAGGITTLVDMPLDSVPTTVNTAALEAKRDAARGQCHVDVAFWGGVISGNGADLRPLHEAGVAGFKCFLADSGSDDFPPVTPEEMTRALAVLRELGAPLLVHAEDAQATAALGSAANLGPRYADYLAARPRGLENLAVAHVIEAARQTGGHAHVVHLSSSDALPMIASARREGVQITAETCPHYLALTAEEIKDGQTAFKCSPPIREAPNRELLWGGLRSGILDMVVTDHSPSTPEMKQPGGDFGPAWGGISSLQLGLPVVWTQARERGFSVVDLARWMAERPAGLAGLTTKGRIAPGFDADFCVFAPDDAFFVDPELLRHRHSLTPYTGQRLTGQVRSTILRGEFIERDQPRGRMLARSADKLR
ncbi:MAG: allantoinase AllB [Streptosporangiaceae bacterium]